MPTLRLSDCSLDLESRRGTRGSESFGLTTKEAALLTYLADRAGEDVAVEDLHRDVWGYGAAVVSRAVFHTVRRLRQKIEPDPLHPVHLLAVHGTGYRLAGASVAPDLPAAPRPTRFLDRFVGREPAFAALGALLPGHVTLVGPIGVGKTRLAAELLTRWPAPDGWFVDAADADRPERLAAAVAPHLGRSVGPDPVDEVGAALAQRPGALLVLDSLPRTAAAAIPAWRSRAPRLAIVVTALEPMRVAGERIWVVPPLEPQEARALFLDRSGRADDPSLDALLPALDGVPLQIELAAVRAAAMSPSALLARLGALPQLLSDPEGDRPERHRRLESAFAETVAPLPPALRSALDGLTVFAGGCSLDAAESVLGADGSDALLALVARGLVRFEADRERYVVGSALSAWLASHADPAALEQVRDRHLDWMVAFALSGRPRIHSDGLGPSLRAELPNARAALARAIALRRAEPALRLAWFVLTALSVDGPLGEGLEVAASVEALGPEVPVLYARMLFTAASIAISLGQWADRNRLCAAAVGWLEHAGDPEARFARAVLPLEGDRLTAPVALEVVAELEALLRERPDWHYAIAGRLAMLEEQLGRVERARSWAQRTGDGPYGCLTRLNHALLLARIGRWEEAEEALDAAEREARRLESRSFRGFVHQSRGELLTFLGRLDEAEDEIEAALEQLGAAGATEAEGDAWAVRAEIEEHRGRLDTADAAWTRSRSAFERIRHPKASLKSAFQAELCALRGRTEAAHEHLQRALDTDHPGCAAVAHAVAATLAVDRGEADVARAPRAVRADAPAAAAVRARVGRPGRSGGGGDLGRPRSGARRVDGVAGARPSGGVRPEPRRGRAGAGGVGARGAPASAGGARPTAGPDPPAGVGPGPLPAGRAGRRPGRASVRARGGVGVRPGQRPRSPPGEPRAPPRAARAALRGAQPHG